MNELSSNTVENITKHFVNQTGNISKSISEIEQAMQQQAGDSSESLEDMDNLSEEIGRVYNIIKEVNLLIFDTNSNIDKNIIIIDDLRTKAIATNKITIHLINDIETTDKLYVTRSKE